MVDGRELLSFEPVFVSDPARIPEMLQQEDFGAIFVDVVLSMPHSAPEWLSWTATRVLNVVRDTGGQKGIPIFLVSSQWNDTNGEEITRAFVTFGCRSFVHWNEIEVDEGTRVNEDGGYVSRGGHNRLRLQLCIEVSAYKKHSMRTLGESEPIRILHLSDLHFGDTNNELTQIASIKILNKLKSKWGSSPPFFVVVSGDTTESGLPSQFEAGYSWLSILSKRLGIELPSEQALVVPGNHDMSAALAASSGVSLQKVVDGDPPVERLALSFSGSCKADHELTSFAMRPYEDFWARVSHLDQLRRIASGDWVSARFVHSGLIVFGLNTSVMLGGNGLTERRVPKKSLEFVRIEIEEIRGKAGREDLLVIGVVHHSPTKLGDEPILNCEELEAALKDFGCPLLILHGHDHQRVVRTGDFVTTIAAPTPTKSEDYRPPDSVRGMNIVEITRKDGKVIGMGVECLYVAGDKQLKFEDLGEFKLVHRSFVRVE